MVWQLISKKVEGSYFFEDENVNVEFIMPSFALCPREKTIYLSRVVLLHVSPLLLEDNFTMRGPTIGLGEKGFFSGQPILWV